MVDFFAGQIPTAQQLDDTALVGTVVAQLRQTVSQVIATGTVTAITLDTEDYDSLGGHSNVTNPTRYTCQREGWYTFAGGIGMVAVATANLHVNSRWRLNGSDLNGSQVIIPSVTAASVGTTVPARTYDVYLVVGDFVELAVHHNTGANRNTDITTVTQSNMHVVYAGLPN